MDEQILDHYRMQANTLGRGVTTRGTDNPEDSVMIRELANALRARIREAKYFNSKYLNTRPNTQ